jgi:hypothetical protein
MMIIPAAKPWFAWDELEDSPSLRTIQELLDALPDAKLLDSLRHARGKGRNDYPVHVLWGVVVLRVVLRHLTTEATLGELRRNAGLRALIGIDSEAGVPKPWNLSRFEDTLGQEPHRSLLKAILAHEGHLVEGAFTGSVVRGVMEAEPSPWLDRRRPWTSLSPS